MSRPSIHASAVLLGEDGVLVRGAPGSGKSSLVLALIDADRSARLVADDRVVLAPAGGRLVAFAPPALAGLIEIRGQGIARRPFVSPVVIRLVADLLPVSSVPRMPEPAELHTTLEGVDLPRLPLAAGSGDHGLQLRAALAGLS